MMGYPQAYEKEVEKRRATAAFLGGTVAHRLRSLEAARQARR